MKKTIIIFLTFIFLIIGNTVFASNYMQEKNEKKRTVPTKKYIKKKPIPKFNIQNTKKENKFFPYYFRVALGRLWSKDIEIAAKEYNSQGMTPLFDITTKPGFVFSAAFGQHYQSTQFFRSEIEILIQKYNLKEITNIEPRIKNEIENLTGLSIQTIPLPSGSMTTIGFMLNAYLDWQNDSELTPYIMGGIGLTSNNFEIPMPLPSLRSNWIGIGLQAEGGLSWKINERTSINAGYRYFITTGPLSNEELDEIQVIPGSTSNLLLGIRYNF